MLDRLNKFMAKIASGYKTFMASGLLTFVSVYANTKGFDVEAIQLWLENFYANINSLIVLLGGAVVWFRQLGKRSDSDEK